MLPVFLSTSMSRFPHQFRSRRRSGPGEVPASNRPALTGVRRITDQQQAAFPFAFHRYHLQIGTRGGKAIFRQKIGSFKIKPSCYFPREDIRFERMRTCSVRLSANRVSEVLPKMLPEGLSSLECRDADHPQNVYRLYVYV